MPSPLLPQQPKPEATSRVSLSLKQSTVAKLEAYRAHYKTAYGQDISQSALVEAMVLEFIRKDKSFKG